MNEKRPSKNLETSISKSNKGNGRRILVVDNSPVILRFMQHFLEKHGHQVALASDGVTALEVLESFSPEICFIDLIMENISGDKLCRILKSMPEYENVLIVILSAIAAEEQDPHTKYAADAFVAKGPLKEMSSHLLQIIQLLDTDDIERIQGTVLGKENLYAREITRELLNSKEHYETALNHISEGFLELLGDKIIYANPAAVDIVGGTEESILNSKFIKLFQETDEDTVGTLLASAKTGNTTVQSTTPLVVNDKLVLLKIIPVAEDTFQSTLVILGDITRQNQLESQLRNAQKMEAVGTLAGGVAHDLNNVLSGIVSYPDLLLMQLPEDSSLKKPIQVIKSSGEKAATIVQDLLTLTRRGITEKNPVNLNQVISDYLASPEYHRLLSFHSEVEIEVCLEEELLTCIGSEVQMSKIIMNLVSNGAESITERGKVRIVTENVYIDANEPSLPGIAEGEYILLTISDNGAGISATDIERIFEPFYTKKEMGRSGTGLGMTVVWGTVKDHGGHIDIQSSPGKGTTMSIYLPAKRQYPASLQEMEQTKKLAAIHELKGNQESVLIVDDIKDQHEIAAHILAQLGYVAHSAYSGQEAVEFLTEKKVDLVLLDMIMDPGIDGLETYRKISELNPQQKVILVTGYSKTDRIIAALEMGAGRYVKKPYTVERIGRAIKEEMADRA